VATATIVVRISVANRSEDFSGAGTVLCDTSTLFIYFVVSRSFWSYFLCGLLFLIYLDGFSILLDEPFNADFLV